METRGCRKARLATSLFHSVQGLLKIRVNLLESLVKFMQSGGRKIDAWTALHKTVLVPFDSADVDPRAFFNANTLEELHRLEQTT